MQQSFFLLLEKTSMPNAVILYHYFYPVDIDSVAQFSQLSEKLFEQGYSVSALQCNRMWKRDIKFP